MLLSSASKANPAWLLRQVKDAFGDKKGMKGLVLTDVEGGAFPCTASARRAGRPCLTLTLTLTQLDALQSKGSQNSVAVTACYKLGTACRAGEER